MLLPLRDVFRAARLLSVCLYAALSGCAGDSVEERRRRIDPIAGFYVPHGVSVPNLPELSAVMVVASDHGNLAGGVVPVSGPTVRFDRVDVTADRFAFRTKVVRGAHFSFHGTFVQKPPYSHKTEGIVLAGNLQIFRAGKLISEDHVKFRYDRGGEN